jgi:hypothetical protein
MFPKGGIMIDGVRPMAALGYSQEQGWTVEWDHDATKVVKAYLDPPRSVVCLAAPSGVLIVEPGSGRNAVIYNADGSERTRLKPPNNEFTDSGHYFTEFGAAFVENGKIAVVVYPAEARGFVDPVSGNYDGFELWTLWGER